MTFFVAGVIADLQKMPKEVVTTLKTYCESGMFARGKDALSGQASLAMFGNTNQPVEVIVRSSHLFVPMPDVIREDMAFLDRIHYYIPGWEIPKMRVEFFTDHYGCVVDYLAEALRELRKHNFTEIVDRHYSLGSHLNARDVKAVRKTVSGLVKLLYQGKMGIAQHVDTTDFHIEAIDLLANRVPCEAGIALVVAIYSAVKRHSVQPGLMILGDLSIQGNIKAVKSLSEPLQVGMDNSTRRALVPLENKRSFLEVSGDVVERVDPIFYADPMTAAMKGPFEDLLQALQPRPEWGGMLEPGGAGPRPERRIRPRLFRAPAD
jgi:predicted ATP-dependent Lon-type protease